MTYTEYIRVDMLDLSETETLRLELTYETELIRDRAVSLYWVSLGILRDGMFYPETRRSYGSRKSAMNAFRKLKKERFTLTED